MVAALFLKDSCFKLINFITKIAKLPGNVSMCSGTKTYFVLKGTYHSGYPNCSKRMGLSIWERFSATSLWFTEYFIGSKICTAELATKIRLRTCWLNFGKVELCLFSQQCLGCCMWLNRCPGFLAKNFWLCCDCFVFIVLTSSFSIFFG